MKQYCTLVFLSLLWSCNNSSDETSPKKMTLTESVYASVTVQPDSLYQAYSAVQGILDINLTEEGDLVKKGDSILQIINNSPKLNLQNSKIALDLARSNYSGSAAILNEIKDEVAATELRLKNDSVNYFRQKKLWEQNIGSKAEYDNLELAYQLSKNNLRLLTGKYNRTKNELETQLKIAENNYRTSRNTSEDFTVASKINGKVYALYKNPGELVNTMEPVAAIGLADAFILELLVDEVDIVKLNLGQKILITLDSYGNQVFEAQLDKIYPRKDEISQTFKVEALFVAPPEKLFPGLSGEANIIIATKNNALTIPKDFLINDSSVLTEDGTVKIITGLQNFELVEVIDGIDENTVLLKPEQ